VVTTSGSFRLPPGLAGQIIAHARADYPEEACGLISGRDGVAMAIYPGRNVSATPRTTFELDIETLARQIEFEDAGMELVAIYHSHPHGPAVPSEADVERAAYPDALYLICSLVDPSCPVLHAFRYDVRRACFDSAPFGDSAQHASPA
jgi:proteasome lid subunit RPN8/RPN11